ncbi:hypothetical protein K505DRAFT_238891 [Melanomma pulvis-pyrius CBS 109.77]|uniref:Altered inheritance of mitochondria protein 6 n=1 Tax=Melanomma pulvis-pyrius CBS 109.77 TaxID=1314802 RepID=A0A6A6XK27_9PLEO|nr:hypothetical protein K505DRAFT_238891 [Melanomma pulvis-pyrius CBS 109.77]
MSTSTPPPFPRHFHDSELDNSDVESQASSVEASPVITRPKWYNRGPSRSWGAIAKIRELRSRSISATSVDVVKRRRWCRYWLIVVAVFIFFGVMTAIVYFSLVGALIHRLNPPEGTSGLHHIVSTWKEPDENGAFDFKWRDDFSRDIVPKNCHSHNDYWRSVPLYEALAAGCVGIEADIWLTDDRNELLVSHSWSSAKEDRTLRSLYLDPLSRIFSTRNVSTASTEEKEVGLFDADPNVSVILLIDFKNDGHAIWPKLLEQLAPLREREWLTYFDGENVIQGPLTIVGTGNTPFDLVQQNSTNRFIFFDAPLPDISNPIYNTTNSYYASVQMNKAIGHIMFNKLKESQVETIKSQIKAAEEKGLKSRYWDTPGWPISLRDRVWFLLSENGVGMLNVDDLVSATRWNWNWCVVAGLNLCGNS